MCHPPQVAFLGNVDRTAVKQSLDHLSHSTTFKRPLLKPFPLNNAGMFVRDVESSF